MAEEFFVGTPLDDLPVVEYADKVGVFDGGEAVGDDDGGAVAHEVVERFLDEFFGLGVEGGGGFVENHDGRILEDGTCDAEALALPAAEFAAAVADDGLVAVFGLEDEVVGVGDTRSLFHLFGGGVLDAESDVVVYGVVEEDGVLVYVAHEFTEVVEGEAADVGAVDEDGAFGDIIEAGKEVDEGAFP